MTWKSITNYQERSQLLSEEITENLTEQQLKFVREYAIDFHGEQAAIRSGYSRPTARVQASQLLTNLNIKRAVREIAEHNCKISADVSRERVLLEIARLAFYNPTDFMEWSVDEFGRDVFRLKDSSMLTEAQAACIQSITQTNAGISIKFYDKKGSLELLARHMGMLNDKLSINHTGTVTHTVEHNYSVTEKIISSNPDLISQIFSQLPAPDLVEEAVIVEDEKEVGVTSDPV